MVLCISMCKLFVLVVTWITYKWSLLLVTWNHIIAWKKKKLTFSINNPRGVDVP